MKLESLKSSKFGSFKANEIQTQMMAKVTGGGATSQTERTYDKLTGKETGCRMRVDSTTVVLTQDSTGHVTEREVTVYGIWENC